MTPNKDAIIEKLWLKARAVEGYDSSLFRLDACGAWIRRDCYGDMHNAFGWGVDLIFPQKLGGTPIMENMRALHYRNIQSKGSDYPSYRTAVKAEGSMNVDCVNYLVVNNKTRKILKTLYENA